MRESDKIALKDKIDAEIVRLTGDIERLREITKPVGSEDMDEITRMDSIVNKSVNDAALASAKSRLAALEYAKKRIDGKEYGMCDECGDEIPLKRLMAMPETTLCIDCASELKHT